MEVAFFVGYRLQFMWACSAKPKVYVIAEIVVIGLHIMDLYASHVFFVAGRGRGRGCVPQDV